MRFYLIIFIVSIIGIVTLYLIQQQKVQNLEDFIELTHKDPLFYSPFFDTKAFNESLERLHNSEKNLKETAIKNMRNSASPQKEIYASVLQDYEIFPHSFLALLGDISKTTETLLSSPSPEIAIRLLTLYEHATEAYINESERGVAAMEKIFSTTPDNRPQIYFFVDSATSLKTILADYKLILQNGHQLKKEILSRKNCLYGKSTCNLSDKESGDIEMFLSGLDILPPDLSSEVANFVKDTMPLSTSTTTVSGPYPIDTKCWQGNSPQWLYLLSSSAETPIVLPKLAEQNYYRLVHKNAPDRLSQALAQAGYTFYLQPEATTYECTDLTFYPKLLTLDFVKTKINNGEITLTDVDNNEALVLLIRNQFSLLPPVFNLIANLNNLLETSQTVNAGSILSPQFLFLARSAYSLTYLPFAESVWRISEKPKYLLSSEEISLIKKPVEFKTFLELKEYGFTDEEIRSSHINQKAFIESLVNQ